MTGDDARRKLRSLRALAAPGSGATPAERETAQAMIKVIEDELRNAPRSAPGQPPIPAGAVIVTVEGFGAFAVDPNVFNFRWSERGDTLSDIGSTNTTTGW